jgi:hypothetical protein
MIINLFQPGPVQHHTEQIITIVNDAMKPWLKQIDDHVFGISEDSTSSEIEDDDDHPTDSIK